MLDGSKGMKILRCGGFITAYPGPCFVRFQPLKITQVFRFSFSAACMAVPMVVCPRTSWTVHVCTYIKSTRGWESAQNARKIDACTSGNAFTKLRGRLHVCTEYQAGRHAASKITLVTATGNYCSHPSSPRPSSCSLHYRLHVHCAFQVPSPCSIVPLHEILRMRYQMPTMETSFIPSPSRPCT